MTVFSRVKIFTKQHPIVRGMISYSLIWPLSNLLQQTALGKRWNTYNWWEAFRFSLYGGLYVAPTLYSWVRVAGLMWPQRDIKIALVKAAVETVTYTPFAMVSFFFGMSLMELKSFNEAIDEVKVKFLPTYKVGASIWPAVATINFAFIPEKNRVPFISVCSLIWTSFLAYMKHLEAKELEGKTLPLP